MSERALIDPMVPSYPTRAEDGLAPCRYTRVAIALHWTIAFLILFNLAVGFFMEGLPQPARKFVITAHLSAGMTVLVLTAIRIIWRLTHRPPSLIGGLHAWERWLAKSVHILFYAAMVVMPVSGWLIISANPPVGSHGAAVQQQRADDALARGLTPPPARVSGLSRFWWIAPLPPLAPVARLGAEPDGLQRQFALHQQAVDVHAWLAYIMIALVFLHLGGALKHQVIDRQPQLDRMGLRFRRRSASDA